MAAHAHTGELTLSNSKNQSERVIAEVSQIYLVPTDETPTVAKIQDTSKIQSNQTFYANAKNGDFLLVYNKAGLALLYRESANKLINVRPIIVDTTSAKN
jgi:hypothetical protein